MNDSISTMEQSQTQYYFSVADYVVFGSMLVLSALTGIYHGCRGRKSLTTRKYLMGSNMQVFPVAMSLIARLFFCLLLFSLLLMYVVCLKLF